MKRRLLAEATRLGLLDNRNKGSHRAFQRFKCIPSECEEKAEETMGSLHPEFQELHTELSALRKSASSYWANREKHLLQEPLKKKVASLQDEMKGLRADTAASLRNTVSIRAYLDSHTAAMHILISSVRADMSKGHKEHLDMCTRINAQVDCMSADVSDLCEQVSKMKGQCHSADVVMSDLNGTVAAMKADMANIADPHIAPRLIMEMHLLREEVAGLRADMLICMERRQTEIKSLTDDMAKLICHRGADVALPPVISQLQPIDGGMVPSSPVALEDNDLSTKIDKNLREAKVQMDLLNKMHAEMERLCGVVETMNGNANVLWSNVIAQEKGIMETQELMHTVLSNVESYTTDKERANVVLVKIVGAFLVCTTAFYAWIVWSFNSIIPF